MCSFDYLISPVWLKREGKKLLFVLIGAEKNSFDKKKKKVWLGEEREIGNGKWDFIPSGFSFERDRKHIIRWL